MDFLYLLIIGSLLINCFVSENEKFPRYSKEDIWYGFQCRDASKGEIKCTVSKLMVQHDKYSKNMRIKLLEIEK